MLNTNQMTRQQGVFSFPVKLVVDLCVSNFLEEKTNEQNLSQQQRRGDSKSSQDGGRFGVGIKTVRASPVW